MEWTLSVLFTLVVVIREVNSECFVLVNGRGTYSGTKSTTATGRTCQRWDTNTPHYVWYSCNGCENYCRDPSKDGYPWCYTTDPNKRWEGCGIPECQETTTTPTTTTTTVITPKTTGYTDNNTKESVGTTEPSNSTADPDVQTAGPDVQTTDPDVQTTVSQYNPFHFTTELHNNYVDFVNPSCTCPCVGRQNLWYNYFNGNLTQGEKDKILIQEKERIKQVLSLDTTELSSFKRKKNCAVDNRPTVRSMGAALGIGILGGFFVIIFIGDIITCIYCRGDAKSTKQSAKNKKDK